MPVASLLAQQLGGIRVKRQLPVRPATRSATFTASVVTKTAPAVPAAAVAVAAPVPAPSQVIPRDVLLAAHVVKSVAISEKDANKILTFTLTDNSVETVVVESTADLEAKVEALATKIVELQKQAIDVASRIEAIERVI